MDTQATTPEPIAVTPLKATVNWAGVALFIILTFAISWTIWLGLGALGVPFGIRTAIGMFGPAIAATLVRLLRREGFADAGLRLAARERKGVVRIYIAAYILPPVWIAAGIGLALLTGVQHWAFSDNLHTLARSLTAQMLGVIGLIPMIAFAIWLAFTGRLKPDVPQATITNMGVQGA